MTGPARLGGIARAFEAAKRERRGAFLPFLTSGFPDLVESDRLAAALCEEGADVLELGVPFSDPVADGPVIQRASEAALRAGATLAHTLGQAMRLHARHDTPIVLMTYLNPVLRYGTQRFVSDAAAALVDGVILVDLPPEEEPELWDALRAAGIDTVTLVAPTTEPGRLVRIAERASGFLYVVARLGVTGQGRIDAALDSILDRCRELTPLPRCLGFGMDLKTPIGRYRGKAEGIVVGSALLETILEGSDPRSREERARGFVRGMRARLPELSPL
ncbi:MAG: tryptophan synthase subunit alpha [Candidatus Eisenbacteria bacterium]|uniref:Tryptophan synthase alpha chain n=1 Tax=Eiseniibacteriota bacterium TaxID=2212470 RepID=A0A538S6Z4_UNCEI|nr:MAG: tryptophan synthase subunit alpha [Candidatus Eisenbacteria bacterium]